MIPQRCINLCWAAVLTLAWAGVPLSATAQNAAVQIQVSNADATQQLALTLPTGLQGVQPDLAPWIAVVGADAVGRTPLQPLDTASPAAAAAPEAGATGGETAGAVPRARIQVANADAIGRFDLQAPGATSTDEAGATATAPGALLPAARIQVTGADAVGSWPLSPPGAAAAAGSAEPVLPEPTAAPVQQPAANAAGTVIADGTLNIRSGPSRDFDAIGQLENGAQVTILSVSPDAQWLLVMTESGLTGWVAAQFIQQ